MMAWLGALGLNVVLYFFVLYTGNLRLYVTRMDIIGVLVVATVLIVALFKRWRTLFVLVLLGIIMVSGAFVNQFLEAFLLSMVKISGRSGRN